MWISRCLPAEPLRLSAFSISMIFNTDYGLFVFLRLRRRYNRNSTADSASPALKTVNYLHNNNSFLLDNSNQFRNNKANNL